MTITFTAILIGLFAIIRPLQKNGFYILNSLAIVAIAYYIECNYFKTTMFSQKTIMLFLVFQIISINITTFFAYGIDKKRAKKKQYRVPEKTLLMLELLGGFVGAFIGQKFFNHKTKKKSFLTKFWLVFLLEIFLIIYIIKVLFYV
ncbi:MAG: DUF1294 domain-containing protein [Alphaproteobacteria bacterium]